MKTWVIVLIVILTFAVIMATIRGYVIINSMRVVSEEFYKNNPQENQKQ